MTTYLASQGRPENLLSVNAPSSGVVTYYGDDDGCEGFPDPVRSFLILQLSDPDAPIWVWDYDGWRIYPLGDADGDADRQTRVGQLFWRKAPIR